ncbi:hypothetical protein Sste5346_006078 [Sporothrix stenoceras]|uniref:Fido domain-containing protein n=1 Tax=Sporothrix stenoceras TaxID=5173 RepID=A0ABR3Z170_9PEZI
MNTKGISKIITKIDRVRKHNRRPISELVDRMKLVPAYAHQSTTLTDTPESIELGNHLIASQWVAETAETRSGLDEDQVRCISTLAIKDLDEGAATIHPFVDGNGRVSRLMMQGDLMRQGYLPACLKDLTRDEYLKMIRHAADGDPSLLVDCYVTAQLELLTAALMEDRMKTRETSKNG